MKKAYCVVENLNEEAQEIIKENNIELIINKTGKKPTYEEMIELLKKYDILIIGIRTPIKKEMLEEIHSKKIIGTLSIGLDHIDKEVLKHPLVEVVNIKLANTVSVAEHIFSLILSLNKRIYESNHLVLKQKGSKSNLCERPEDITGKTLGLIGAGNITKEVIKIAKVFHMNINCYTSHPEKHSDLLEEGVHFLPLDEVLKNSDIINIDIPLTEDTRNLISKEKIELIKPTATFINTSRRDVVDTKALIDYADKNKTFYVGLDIDLDGYEELFSKYRENVIITPHTAGISKQAIHRMDIELSQNIVDLVNKNML